MGYSLIITEKPNAAKKISDALAEGKAVKKNAQGVPYYEITHKGQDIMIVSAVGHIFGLSAKKDVSSSEYPVFDIEWVPSYQVSKGSSYTKKYLALIKKFAKDADSYVVATDYDIEGEVIGLNVVRFACKQKDAERMKFSTLTKQDLIDSFQQRSKTLDWGQANAGETRHMMDWFFGINLSRALTNAIKATGRFKLMSTGRVQGPALKLIVEKEKEIQKFVPEPFSQIELIGTVKKKKVTAYHKEDKIFDKTRAQEIFDKCKDAKQAIVESVKRNQFQTQPPFPFDLTSLQMEANKCLKISPKETLQIAQELYTGGYTSYPRTSSQQLPPSVGYQKILKALQRNSSYAEDAKILLGKPSLKPNNGKKTDPAHPAIYPTGLIPDFKNKKQEKVYDLIVRRFLSTFGEPATRETLTVTINCNDEPFVTKGTTTKEKGWFTFYRNYVMLKEEELPPLAEKDNVNVSKVNKLDKETTPPKRYTQATIIKALEKANLGTKATRAAIIDTLYNRKYVEGKSITATEIGMRTEEILEKYSPKIVDPELTRHFEEEMEEIREKKKTKDIVLSEAKDQIKEILTHFDKHLKEIGTELLSATDETRFNQSYIGKCVKCKTGNLVIRKGKYGQFVACDNYPDCKTAYALPKGKVTATEDIEPKSGLPIIEVQRPRSSPRRVCLDPNYPLEENDEDQEKIKQAEKEKEGKPCPKCGEGKLVVRKSHYGTFIGCSKYPDCKYVEQVK
jgi:DNA topoisomerase-1